MALMDRGLLRPNTDYESMLTVCRPIECDGFPSGPSAYGTLGRFSAT
jgi:hypothetical protein